MQSTVLIVGMVQPVLLAGTVMNVVDVIGGGVGLKFNPHTPSFNYLLKSRTPSKIFSFPAKPYGLVSPKA